MSRKKATPKASETEKTTTTKASAQIAAKSTNSKANASKAPKSAGHPKRMATTNGTNVEERTTTTKKANATKNADVALAKPRANEAKKRKLSSSESGDENTADEEAARKKRVRSKKDEDDTKTKAATKPAPKPKPTKAAKSKVVINERPTQRMDVFVFGEGSAGELGLGTAKSAVDVKRPRLNPNLPASTVGVVQVAVGGMHCAALTYDGKVYTWGVNDQRALGRDTQWEGGFVDMDANDGDSDSKGSDSGLNPRESTPTPLPTDAFPGGTVIVQVAAGDSTTYALTDEGLVYGWGTYRVSILQSFHLVTAKPLPEQRRRPWFQPTHRDPSQAHLNS